MRIYFICSTRICIINNVWKHKSNASLNITSVGSRHFQNARWSGIIVMSSTGNNTGDQIRYVKADLSRTFLVIHFRSLCPMVFPMVSQNYLRLDVVCLLLNKTLWIISQIPLKCVPGVWLTIIQHWFMLCQGTDMPKCRQPNRSKIFDIAKEYISRCLSNDGAIVLTSIYWFTAYWILFIHTVLIAPTTRDTVLFGLFAIHMYYVSRIIVVDTYMYMYQGTGASLVQTTVCHMCSSKLTPEPIMLYYQVDTCR